MTNTPRPTGLAAAGRKLWDAVTTDFALAEHELAQLEEACRCRDTIATLRTQLRTDGTMIESSQGQRLHPAIAEIRAQQLALARLLATLQVPGLDEDADGTPNVRAVRGVYAPRGPARTRRRRPTTDRPTLAPFTPPDGDHETVWRAWQAWEATMTAHAAQHPEDADAVADALDRSTTPDEPFDPSEV